MGGYGSGGHEEDSASQPPRLGIEDSRASWSLMGRRTAGAILGLLCAGLAITAFTAAPGTGVRDYEVLVSLPKGEHKVVDAAEDATIDFASKDVSEAALNAQKEAKAQYAKMMATALKAEAQAHKLGEKATAMSLKEEDNSEHEKMLKQQQRAMRDRLVQERKDEAMSRDMDDHVDRTLVSRVLEGQ